jgi:hypothetical protein
MRTFDLSDVLSITTGRLVSTRHMNGIYDILNYLTGDNLFTHQLPRAMEWAKPKVLELHPGLRDMDAALANLDRQLLTARARSNAAEVVTVWVDSLRPRLGDTLDLPALDGWTQIDPISELVAMQSPSN